ncbi:hypothetical protein M0R45_004913 [Rubus argutus]|uniref:Uncharacterized protein n=1 Tax=Rubus argutus TaxID=59490 RepID=A0AAW1YL76_RUBAR
MELEACHSLIVQLKLQNEELSVMLLVLKLGISEAQLKIANEQSEMVLLDNEKEEYISLLMEQLQMKNAALVMAQTCIEEERAKTASLSRRIDALDLIEKQQLQMLKELDRECREVNDALERANTELAEKISEGSEIEIELHIWKSITENLRIDLEASLGMRKELEASLLAEVDVGETIKQENKGLLGILEEKDKTVENLQQQILLLEPKLKTTDAEDAGSAKIEAAMSLEKLHKEIGWLEQESLTREFTVLQYRQTTEGNVGRDGASFDNQGPGKDLEWNDELVDPEKENVSSTATMMKKTEPISDIRSPFRDLNT